jgi:hypothetical protein
MKPRTAAGVPALLATPTQAQLRAAYQRLHRSHWPATLEAALASEWFSKLLHCAARSTPAAPAVQRTPPRTRRTPALFQPPRFDARRAAANDLED